MHDGNEKFVHNLDEMTDLEQETVWRRWTIQQHYSNFERMILYQAITLLPQLVLQSGPLIKRTTI